MSARDDYPHVARLAGTYPNVAGIEELDELAAMMVEIDRLRSAKPGKRRRARTEAARFDQAVDRVLNSGLMLPYMDDFWAFVDGKLSWREFDERMSR
jgi:hypothetical protein